MKKLKIIYDGSPIRNSCVTVGNFDGFHFGHQEIIEHVVRTAAHQSLAPSLVTFDPHPRQVLNGESPPVLTTMDERVHFARRYGIKRFVVVPFDTEIASWEPEKFVEDLLLSELSMKAIVLGHDHRFGRRRQGDDVLLDEMGGRYGFTVQVAGPTQIEGTVVSSSLIRYALKAGNAKRAADLLGHFYSLSGSVVRGDSRGKSIGFPTANLETEENKLVPADGVYAVRVFLPDESRSRNGMLNIGKRPTFGGSSRTVEVHVLDFDGDLYGREVRVEFVARIRDERRFEAVEALVAQLNEDAERCTAALKTVP